MPPPASTDEFLSLLRKSSLLAEPELDTYLQKQGDALPSTAADLAAALVHDGLLTNFQADQLLKGKWRGYLISDKYRLLEHLGSGGMATVFLCEHVSMHRRVAIKVLPTAQASDSGALERFYREARAVAQLDHPNIVRAHDIDHDGKLHFLVMEYVDGSSLQEIVRRRGRLEVTRAAHYIRQVALGLHQAHLVGLVHRDIKPGNLLLDRQGVVKILDMGLARFFHEDIDGITKKYDDNCVLGTADYCAPEQALNSHAADIRADIYSLGATFYFLLTGEPPFGSGTTAQKILWHQMKDPTPIRQIRPEVPEKLAAIINKMMAKDPAHRFQTPAEVYEALGPWTLDPIAPPPDEEMPSLCPRSQGPGSGGSITAKNRINDSLSSTPAAGLKLSEALSSSRNVVAASPSAVPLLPTKPPPSRTGLWLAVGGAAVLVLLVGSLGLWWMLTPPKGTQTTAVPTSPSISGIPPETGKTVVPHPSSEVVILPADGGTSRVKTPHYEAVIAANGYLTSLRIGGSEFLAPGSGTVRLVQEGVPESLPLASPERAGADVLTANGPNASIRYEFGTNSLSMNLTNSTDRPLTLQMTFDPQVNVVGDGAGKLLKVPVKQDWPKTTWFRGPAKLTLTGGTRISGEGTPAQETWHASIPAQANQQVTLATGQPSKEESDKIAGLLIPVKPAMPPAPSLALSKDNSTHVMILGVDGHAQEIFGATNGFDCPNWSQDGTYLLLSADGKLWKLPVVPGGKPEAIPSDPSIRLSRDHGFSPNGKQIAVTGSTGPIYVLPVSGGVPQPVTTSPGPSYFHSWSPDGKTMLFVSSRGGNLGIWSIPAEGGEEKRLTFAQHTNDGPDFSSPDGQWIYFNSNRSGKMDIWRMPNRDNGDAFAERITTSDDNEYFFPHPSPDGKWLVCLVMKKGQRPQSQNQEVALHLMPVLDGKPAPGSTRILAQFTGGMGTINGPSWAPDGKRFAFIAYTPAKKETTQGK